MVKKILRHIFSKDILHIIIGNFNRFFDRKQYLYESRYSICKYCQEKGYYDKLGEICNVCGCPLQSKLRVKDGKCDLNEW